jgi:hypothetical protein
MYRLKGYLEWTFGATGICLYLGLMTHERTVTVKLRVTVAQL